MSRTQTCSFTTTVSRYTTVSLDANGVEVETPLSPQEVLQQIVWLTDLVNSQANAIVFKRFNTRDLVTLHRRSNPKDSLTARKVASGDTKYFLPASAWVAANRLGWVKHVKKTREKHGVYLPERMLRMVGAAAIENLRSTARRAILTDALINYKDNGLTLNEVLNQLKDQHHITTSQAELAIRFNAIGNFEKQAGPFTRFSFTDMEKPAVLSNRLLAYAADDQFQQYLTSYRDDNVNPDIVWEIKLPTCSNPQSGKDYHRVRLYYKLPGYVQNIRELNTPTIRVGKDKQGAGRLMLDCSYVRYVKPAAAAAKRRYAPVVAFDWGVRNPVTLIVGHKSKKGEFVLDSRPQYFKCEDLFTKRQNLQDENDELLTKIKRLTVSRSQCVTSGNVTLQDLLNMDVKIEQLELTRDNVNSKRSELVTHVAYAVAHWVMDQVVTTGALTVYHEDLKTLNTKAKTQYSPVRHALTVAIRSKIFDYLKMLCQRNGVVLKEVNARDTSKTCSKCDSLDTVFYTHSVSRNPDVHRHYSKPVEKNGGKWFYCNSCGYCVDRDYNASVNIARFGLKTTTLKKDSKTGKVNKVVKIPKSVHDRKKRFATPRRPAKTKDTAGTYNSFIKSRSPSFALSAAKASSWNQSGTHPYRCMPG